jgi:hypothetical protein
LRAAVNGPGPTASTRWIAPRKRARTIGWTGPRAGRSQASLLPSIPWPVSPGPLANETMNIFIDTSALLEFYLFPKDQVVVVDHLATVTEKGLATLLLPDQVKKEFWKNREGKIDKAIKEFASISILERAPAIIREHPDFAPLQEAVRIADTKHRDLVNALRNAAREEDTSIDKLMVRLFAAATNLEASPETITRAMARKERGLPPGKKGSIGDELNWETLLEFAPDADVAIVSQDGDYASDANKSDIRKYLEVEWHNKKKGKASLYPRVSALIAAHFPGAESAADIEKDIRANALLTSGNFATTHKAIAELAIYDKFPEATARKIATAFIENDQVRWIKDDEDVKEFFGKFMDRNKEYLTDEQKKNLE